jgi:hypothetical protein
MGNLLKDVPDPGGLLSLQSLWMSIKTIWENTKRLNLLHQPTYYTSLVTASGSLSALITAIGSASVTLYVNSTVTIAANLTIPSNISVVVLKGGSFSIDSGVTLTLNCPFQAGLFRIFTGAGTVAGNPRLAEIFPEWWGAVGDDTTNDVTAITACLTFVSANYDLGGGESPQIVLTYSYKCNSGITIPNRVDMVGKSHSAGNLNRNTARLNFTSLGTNTKAITIGEDSTLRGIVISGPGESVSGTYGIYGGLEYTEGFGIHNRILDCTVEDFETGIILSGWLNLIEKSKLDDCQYGIVLQHAANGTVIHNCDIEVGSTANKVGIYIKFQTDRAPECVMITENWIESTLYGIVVEAGKGIIIAHNRFEITNKVFIDVRGRNAASDADLTVDIHHNYLLEYGSNASGGGRYGIWVQAGRVSIDDNEIDGYNANGYAENAATGGRFSLTSTTSDGTFNDNTLQITDTVTAGNETITWTANAVVIAVQAGVSTVAQVLAGAVSGTPWATLASVAAGTVAALATTAVSELPGFITENRGLQYAINFGGTGILYECLIGKNRIDAYRTFPDTAITTSTREKIHSRFHRVIEYLWDLGDNPGDNVEHYFRFIKPVGYSTVYSIRSFCTFNIDDIRDASNALTAIGEIDIGYREATPDLLAYMDNFEIGGSGANQVTYATDTQFTTTGETFFGVSDSRVYLIRMEPGDAKSGRVLVTLVLDEFQY